jgi:hypothetical protein
MSKKKNDAKPKDLQSDSKTVKVSMEIDHHLTPEELAENKEHLMKLMDEVDALTIEKKKAAKAFKSQINLKETDIIILRDADRTKKVKKTMDVDVMMNFKTGKKTAIHPQTGELLWEKDLTPEDRQEKMF